MGFLNDFPWNSSDQSAIDSYWKLYDTAVMTGNGQKTITAVGGLVIGIDIIAYDEATSFTTGDNKDTISGTGYVTGIRVESATLRTGKGDDSITGRGGLYGIYSSYSKIDTGGGKDRVIGDGSVHGIYTEFSVIRTGDGDDDVIGTSSFTKGAGISNYSGLIDTRGNQDVQENSTKKQAENSRTRDKDRVLGTSIDGLGIANIGVGETPVGKAVGDQPALGQAVITTGDDLDKITGTSTFDAGILNAGGVIDTGAGADEIRGEGGMQRDYTEKRAHGILNLDSAVIATQDGRDKVIGTSKFGDGIHNEYAQIDTGIDNDNIEGTSESGNGILNISASKDVEYSVAQGPSIPINNGIYTGDGIDRITGATTTGVGIKNGNWSIVTLPNQAVAYNGASNTGLIDTGSQGDTLTGTASGLNGIGISNSAYSRILTWDGADTVMGTATGTGGIGIYNDGTIDTRTGKDIVNALKGGFSGSGAVMLGEDDDTLIGFGTGNFYGGGESIGGADKILLGTGVYTIDATNKTITAGTTVMNVDEFEKIGGSSSGLFGFASGTLTVNLGGVGTFVAGP